MLTITVDPGPDQLGLKLEAQSRTDLAKLSGRNPHICSPAASADFSGGHAR
jgi:hypothetical protein